MRLTTRQWRKEDFPGLLDAEPRFEEFLTALNQQQKALESILNGGVGTENLNRQVTTLEIAKGQAYPVKVKVSGLRGKPIGVKVMRAIKTTTKKQGEPVGAAFHVDWSMDGGTLLVDGLPGLSGSDSYRLTIEIAGG